MSGKTKTAEVEIPKDTISNLTVKEVKALGIVWPLNCKFGILDKASKKLLHASDSEKWIIGMNTKMHNPKSMWYKPNVQSIKK